MNRVQHRELSKFLDEADEVISATEQLCELVYKLYTFENGYLYWKVVLPNTHAEYKFRVSKQLSEQFLVEMRNAMLDEMNQIEAPTLHS
jgi:hypothetical protein